MGRSADPGVKTCPGKLRKCLSPKVGEGQGIGGRAVQFSGTFAHSHTGCHVPGFTKWHMSIPYIEPSGVGTAVLKQGKHPSDRVTAHQAESG